MVSYGVHIVHVLLYPTQYSLPPYSIPNVKAQGQPIKVKFKKKGEEELNREHPVPKEAKTSQKIIPTEKL